MRFVVGMFLISTGVPRSPAQEIRTVQVASGISAPTDIQNAGDGSGRLFLVRQAGLVSILKDGIVLATPFLDLRAKTRADGERGLLGLAFPPGYGQSGRFYVDYTDLNGDTIVAQYRVGGDPNAADPGSEVILLKVAQPFANHNGGQIRFGPDGFLYIALGDGGSGGDPMGNGQNLNTLLGKLLRVDPEASPGQLRIPSTNPFVNRAGTRGEIWAYGLRNPWRFTFDRATHDLWIADVGQGLYEEVDFQPASSPGGENYGWNRMEGLHCYQFGCQTAGLTLPVAEYPHSEGCSITGGFVYRGNLSPGLRGTYVYGDYCSGMIWGLERRGSNFVNRPLLASGFGITAFGEDEAGELYIANAANGTIHRIEGSRAPRFSAASVVDAASFQSGIVAGSLATVFAAGVRDDAGSLVADGLPLPQSLGGISVGLDGIAAPVYSLSNVNGQEQLSFQVPWEIAGRSNVSLVITRDGQASAAADVPVNSAHPGVFTVDGAQAIAVHANYTLANPASPLARGEFAFVYVSGLGAVSNQPASGAAGPSGPLAAVGSGARATIGGVRCDVLFAGLAPGLAGIYQLNFQVAAGVASGSQDLVVESMGMSSTPVKVTVR